MVSMCELFVNSWNSYQFFLMENANIKIEAYSNFPLCKNGKSNQVNKWDMRMAFVLITGLVLTYYTIHNYNLQFGISSAIWKVTKLYNNLLFLFTRIYLLHYIIQTRFPFVYPFVSPFAFAFLFSVFIFILFLLLVFSMSFTFACFALVYVIGCIYLMWILFFSLVGFGLVGFGVYIIGFQCAYSHE